MTKSRDLANFATAGGAVSATELGFVDGVTSAIQTQLDAKALPANVINNTFVDAKGDLISATANDTPARLAVGANGETLVADSSTATGLRYQGSISAGRNFVINGSMDVWQRGATGLGTSTGSYTADRWVLGSSSTTVTRDTDVPTSPYFSYSLKMVGASDNSIIQKIESANSTLLAGQTVTFSFYAKRTSGAGALDVRFYYPSATDNFASVTQIGSTVVVSASPSSSWTRYSVTAAIGTNITTGLQILINNTGAATTFITGVQLELGSVATQFSRAGGTIQGELAACQRYYYRDTSGNSSSYHATAIANGTTAAFCLVNNPVQMRLAVPTSIDFTNLLLTLPGSTNFSITGLTIEAARCTALVVSIKATGAVGLVDGMPYFLTNSSSAGYLGFSAEL
jgi:hypothetical protein